jgi:dTDP-glucose 4,6-dehydratase
MSEGGSRQMSLQGRRVLVTGAGGFIGSHLAERLVREGAEVRAMVHYNALGSRGWLDRSPLVQAMEVLPGDITDADSTRQACAGVEVIFHLAALIAIPYSYVAPRSYVRTNVEGTVNVLQAARDLGAARVIQTSTSEVYGTARIVPIPESHPLQAQSPYAASKIASDKIAESFHLSFGLPVTILRPFNTFGPRQSARAVIPTVIRQLLAGDEVRIGNTAPRRDFNFVANTVDAFVTTALADRAIGATVHFGSGREISVGDMIHAVAKILGREPRIVTETQRVRKEGSEVERLIADNSHAAAMFGWQPGVTFEAGLAETIAWFRDQPLDAGASRYVV